MNRLKELRQEKKLSQKELSEKINVHYRTLQNWENGESQIKPDKAKQLADYFGVSVGYLLGYSYSDYRSINCKITDSQEIELQSMTGTDVSRLMLKLGYEWSNEAQIYVYKAPGKEYLLQPLSREVAELICLNFGGTE